MSIFRIEPDHERQRAKPSSSVLNRMSKLSTYRLSATRKARTSIPNWLASERKAVQDQQAHKDGRKRQAKDLCSRSLSCIRHDFDPCVSIFVFGREEVRARVGPRASIRRLPPSIGRRRKPIRRCNTEVRKCRSCVYAFWLVALVMSALSLIATARATSRLVKKPAKRQG